MLTKEQIDFYVKEGGMICPYCELDNLEWGEVEMTASGAFQDVSCNDCGKTWSDEHTLIGITESIA